MSDTEAATDSQPNNARRRHWRTAVAFVAFAAWLIGTAIRHSIRDASPLTAPLFYALPVPVSVVAGFIAARQLARIGRRRVAAVLTAIVAVQACVWIPDAWSNKGEDNPTATRFLLWNVCRGNLGYDAITERIAVKSPDIVAVIEAFDDGQTGEFWESRLPGYSATCLGKGFVLLIASGSRTVVIERTERGQLPGYLRYRIISLRINDQPLAILLADLKSSPLQFRRPSFERLDELVRRFDDRSLIVAGDFNTPVDSVHFGLLRSRLTNAFEAAGAGYRETWPVVFPVLSLDQIWGNEKVHWHRCWSEASLRSDHRLMIAEFATECSRRMR